MSKKLPKTTSPKIDHFYAEDIEQINKKCELYDVTKENIISVVRLSRAEQSMYSHDTYEVIYWRYEYDV